jgi:hypothetical protein
MAAGEGVLGFVKQNRYVTWDVHKIHKYYTHVLLIPSGLSSIPCQII